MNSSFLKWTTVSVYAVFLILVFLAFSRWDDDTSIAEAAMLLLAESYFLWLWLAFIALSEHQHRETKIFGIISLSCMVTYGILWAVVFQVGNIGNGMSEDLDNLLGITAIALYGGFFYINIKLAKQLVQVEHSKKRVSRSYAYLSLVLIFLPILSFPFLHNRVSAASQQRA